MKLYRHWVAETREIAGTTFHLRDGSNVSPEDAAAKLERRAAILRASEGRDLSEEESAAVREALLDLGGRTPEGEYEAAICEEILDEPDARNAVTRNRYGAEVLNSEDTCFLDVDEVFHRESAFEWIRRWSPAVLVFAVVTALFALGAHRAVSKDPTSAFALYPSAVICGIVCAIPAIVMAHFRRPTATDDAEATLGSRGARVQNRRRLPHPRAGGRPRAGQCALPGARAGAGLRPPLRGPLREAGLLARAAHAQAPARRREATAARDALPARAGGGGAVRGVASRRHGRPHRRDLRRTPPRRPHPLRLLPPARLIPASP